MNNKTPSPIPSVIFYSVAILLVAFAIWSFTYWADLIRVAIEQGQLPEDGREYRIVNYYMINCFQYVVFAMLLTAAGVLLQNRRPRQNESDKYDRPDKYTTSIGSDDTVSSVSSVGSIGSDDSEDKSGG